jgi:hypothetical protein
MANIKFESIKDFNKVVDGINFYNLLCDEEGINWQDGETLGTFEDIMDIIRHRSSISRRISGLNYIITYTKVIDNFEFIVEGVQNIRSGGKSGDELGSLLFSNEIIIKTNENK